MDRFDPFVKYADVYGDIINWEKDPMNKPQNQNKYFFSDGKTYYEQICKMLRLMSVFKEAFNQIYSNEDEISEAWENFVNNLSASVVEGSEPDVTLTWTDDSVNFEFTMVPGVPGEQGVGITSISFNSDYTMTITLSDGNAYTSMSLKGETGPQGPQGETGSGLQILDVYPTLADLQSAHPTGQPGDAYQVGSEGSYTLYIWSSSQSAWVPAGTLGTVSPSVSNPLMDGTASAGSLDQYSRGDHVHPTDTSRASKEELDALIKTSQALIDQSFTYRESPAIQDGLARIDKIKGNTLKWNQLVQNGNFADTSGWIASGAGTTLSVANNEATVGITAQYGALSRDVDLVYGHKYFVIVDIKASSLQNTRFGIGDPGYYGGQGAFMNFTPVDTNYHTYRLIGTLTESAGTQRRTIITNMASGQQTLQVKNFMVIDLTMLGLDVSADELLSLFHLPYYDYNAGSLLSFNGTGLKTTGKNLLAYNITDGTYHGLTVSKNEGKINIKGTTIESGRIIFIDGPFYVPFDCMFSTNVNPLREFDYQFRRNGVNVVTMSNSTSIRVPKGWYDTFGLYVAVNRNYDLELEMQLEEGSTVTPFEPYSESTLLLPISTYFPTGMKSAGNAYDELTENKAITRIGVVDLGSLTWESYSGNAFFYAYINDGRSNYGVRVMPNILCAVYQTVTTRYSNEFSEVDKAVTWSRDSAQVQIKDTSYSTVEAFKNAMSGVYLCYELANETETAIDLDLDFIAYEDGTEQLLPVNGSVPSTSPIIADMAYLSIDDAMEYIIDKLANVPENTQQMIESLEDDVADLQTDAGALQPAVSALQTSVGNINTNIGQLSSTVAGHTASISDMQSDITDISTGLNDLEDTVTDNTSRIGTLESGLSTTNGNVQSLSSQVQSIDGRVTNLESDLFKIVVKEFDYDTVAPETNFGTTTPITQEEGYRVIGVVGTEAQAGEYTSPASNIAITQCHVYYTSLGALTITIFGRNNGASSRTNVRIYAYLLCIKDIQ